MGMTKAEATRITGGLSYPSKMPEAAYNLPASACNVGSRLVHTDGSVCRDCYAADELAWLRLKAIWRMSRYATPHVKAAMERRLAAIHHPRWIEAMVVLLAGTKHFRWHDSGDVQGPKHLLDICEVCWRTPNTKHWLPTKEYAVLRELVREGVPFPPNLVIRLSAAMVDGKPPRFWRWTSTVSKGDLPILGRRCPAPQQGGECRDCRACWDKRVPNIDYHYH